MPTCVQCGESEFDCIDGLFYCSLCQTQSQDVRVEEEEEAFVGSGEAQPVVLKAKVDKPEKEKKVIDKGRMWVTHEGFQYILLEQVKSLIKLGAREDLKEPVWRLWMMYLSKVGVAFTKTKEPPKDALLYKCHPRARDVNPGTLENPEVKSVRWRTTRKGRLGLVEKTIVAPAKIDLKESLETEEFYEGDNPLEEEKDADDGDELLFHDVISEAAKQPSIGGHVLPRNQRLLKEKSYKNPARMNLNKTLALCYLGLLYTDSLTGPGDLIRWVKAGKLPYWSASSVLPEDMKFYSYDSTAFNSKNLPAARNIIRDACKLVVFLQIRDTLPSPDILSLIHKYIHVLQLPGDIHGLAANLLKCKPPNIKAEILPNFDVIAMSYIIFILKLLLGLDDSTERKLSTYARKLMDMVPLKQPLFVWEDWYQHMEKTKAENDECIILEKQENIREVRDIEAVTKPLEELCPVRMRRKVELGRPRHRGSITRPEVREALEKCFSLLGGKWRERNPHETVHASDSDSYNTSEMATLMERDPMGFLVDSPKKKQPISRKPKRGLSEDFRKTSLKYITHQENFLEELDKQGLSDFTLYSSCLSSSGSDSEQDNTDQSYDLFDSQQKSYHSSRMTDQLPQKRKRSRAKEAVRKAASNPTASKTSQSLSKEGLMENFAKAYEQYTLYSKESSTYSHHRSYDWLLKLCSSIIDCDEDNLHNFFQKLQCVFMQDAKETLSLKIFIARYFKKKK